MKGNIDSSVCGLINEKFCACVNDLPKTLVSSLRKFEIKDEGVSFAFQNTNENLTSLKSITEGSCDCCLDVNFELEQSEKSIGVLATHSDGNQAFKKMLEKCTGCSCFSGSSGSDVAERCC